MAERDEIGYKHVAYAGNKRLRKADGMLARSVERRVEEARIDEANASARNRHMIYHGVPANSVENSVERVLGRVCFYNGGGIQRGQVSEGESVPNHIKFVDKRDQRQIDRFYEREILTMRHLREARHEISPFRNMIIK